MASEDKVAGDGHGHVRRRRVLLFPLPYQGHINPMFRLAGILHARGFAITVFHTAFNAPDPARHPAYDFAAVADGLPGESPVTLEQVMEHILALNRACAAPFRERLAAALAAAADPAGAEEVACLIVDVHLLSAAEVAAELGVKTMVLRTSSAAFFLGFVSYPRLCEKGYLPAQESQLDMPVVELPPYRVRDLPTTTNAGHAMLCELLARTVQATRSSTGLILNTFDALERPELDSLRRELSVAVFDIGPLHKVSPAIDSSLLRQDRRCLAWLDAQPPQSVLYVSFGSLACMGPEDLLEAAWGLANSGQSFLWVIRPGLVRDAERAGLPEGFEDAARGRGMVVSWAPQEEVLRHRAVGGFWTHCGWNSTLESICEGVPMLCTPCFGDQSGNARYVQEVWGVGLDLDGGALERGELERAIRRLMEGREGGEMRGRARELKRKAMECTTELGSSCLAMERLVDHVLSL